jgi:hypothetical protein
MNDTLPESVFPISTVKLKATLSRTTYPKINMIQRWKREKSVDDQNCPAGVFSFVFQKVSDDDLCQKDYVL